MGMIFDYFTAPSDGDAAAVLDPRDGPSEADRTAQPETTKRSLFRRRPKPVEESAPGPSLLGYPTVEGWGVEPTIKMGTLEAELTGPSADEILDAREDLGVIADRDDGERLVVRLTANLTEALAGATETRLATVATAWAQSEEFGGEADPDDLTTFLNDLSGLARDARARGWSVYCYLCV